MDGFHARIMTSRFAFVKLKKQNCRNAFSFRRFFHEKYWSQFYGAGTEASTVLQREMSGFPRAHRCPCCRGCNQKFPFADFVLYKNCALSCEEFDGVLSIKNVGAS
jgi:hypothetical protein